MSYEPGVLVRRQQREYPQVGGHSANPWCLWLSNKNERKTSLLLLISEYFHKSRMSKNNNNDNRLQELRAEIALAALEVGKKTFWIFNFRRNIVELKVQIIFFKFWPGPPQGGKQPRGCSTLQREARLHSERVDCARDQETISWGGPSSWFISTSTFPFPNFLFFHPHHFHFHFSIFIVPPCRACTRGRSALPEFLPEPREVMRTVGKQVTENFTFDLEKNNKMEFDVKKTRWHWCKIKNNMVMLWNPRRRRRGGWRGWARQPKCSAWRRYETAAGGAWRWDHALCPGIFFPFLMTIVLCL